MPSPRPFDSNQPRTSQRGLKYALAGVALAAALAFTVLAPALDTAEAKGKPGGGTGNSITLNPQADGSVPNLGDTITFSYTVAKGGGEVRIAIICYSPTVGPAWSADAVAGSSFVLGSGYSLWPVGGEVDCVAYLYKRNVVDGELAQVWFHAWG